MSYRPVQVGSHYIFETNATLHFGRAAAYGLRVPFRYIPAGSAGWPL